LSDKLLYNRVQKFGNNNYVYECTGLFSDKEIKKQIPDVISCEKRYVGIIKDEDVRNFRFIKFIGRSAQWNSNIKIQDVIKYAKEFKDEQNIK
jgi:hypothetical protein